MAAFLQEVMSSVFPAQNPSSFSLHLLCWAPQASKRQALAGLQVQAQAKGWGGVSGLAHGPLFQLTDSYMLFAGLPWPPTATLNTSSSSVKFQHARLSKL